MGKMKSFDQKKWGKIGGGSLALVVAGGLIWSQLQYTNQENISKEMEKEVTAYLAQEETEYLVYFYDKDFCETCGDYNKELKRYEKKEGALPVYKTTGKEETTIAFENDLFVDKRYPTVVHVKNGEELFRYVGAYPIDSLPLANQTEAMQELEKEKEEEVVTMPVTEDSSKE